MIAAYALGHFPTRATFARAVRHNEPLRQEEKYCGVRRVTSTLDIWSSEPIGRFFDFRTTGTVQLIILRVIRMLSSSSSMCCKYQQYEVVLSKFQEGTGCMYAVGVICLTGLVPTKLIFDGLI